MDDQASTTAVDTSSDVVWLALFGAWVTALVATLAALFIGEIMGQTPCVLCWYQRVFMFPLPIVLGIGLLRNDAAVWRYALPLSALGMLAAAYHVLEYIGIVPQGITPCTATGPSCSGPGMTIFGWVPIPVLALASFSGISGALLLAQRKTRS